jgi:hypothetical protein
MNLVFGQSTTYTAIIAQTSALCGQLVEMCAIIVRIREEWLVKRNVPGISCVIMFKAKA